MGWWVRNKTGLGSCLSERVRKRMCSRPWGCESLSCRARIPRGRHQQRVWTRERERERVSVRRRNQFCKQGGVFLCLWSPSVSAYRGVSVSKLLWDFYGSTDDTLWTFRTPRSCTYLMLLGIYFLSNIAWFLKNKNVQRLNRWRRV